MRNSSGTRLRRAGDRRAAQAVFDQRSQALRRHAWRGDPHLQLHVARPGGDGVAVGHPPCRACRARPSGCWRALRASSSSMPSAAAAIAMRVAAQDASPARNSQPGVTDRRCRRTRPACRSPPRVPLAWLATIRSAALPARRGRRVVVQARLGTPPQHRLHPLQCRRDVLLPWPAPPRERDSADCGRVGARRRERMAGRRGERPARHGPDDRAGPATRRQDAWRRQADAQAGRAPRPAPHQAVARDSPTPRGDHRHERTHRLHRPQEPPAGRLGQRRLRRHRHHPADRRRAARRGLRPALGRARARRRGRQRQRHAGGGAPRLPRHFHRLRGRRCSTAAPSARVPSAWR